MPFGHRDKSLRSREAHSVTPTLVSAAMLSSEIPRCILIRLRLGPNAAFAASMAPDGPARTLPEPPGHLAGGAACQGCPAASHPETPITFSLELAARRRLFAADPAGGDIGLVIVLCPDRCRGETPEHRKLADMRQRVGNRTLKEPFGTGRQRLVR